MTAGADGNQRRPHLWENDMPLVKQTGEILKTVGAVVFLPKIVIIHL